MKLSNSIFTFPWKPVPHQPTPPTSSHSHNCSRMEEDHHHHHHHQGAPSDTTTRASIKRKLQQPLLNSLLTKPKQGIESPNHEHHSTNSDQPLVIKLEGSAKLDDNATSTGQPSVMSPIPFMPEKRILELVLDILQRQDTHEIFAEPVDPKEVEDYYEIIKEPMDFGTMRAKHHEGMYTNLEQFEARVIYDLAKKVFHVLKTDFENFESEFSKTRRRSSRRPQGEAKGLNFNSSPRFTTNVRSSGMTTDVSSKGTRCSLNGPSNVRRNIQGKPGFSRTRVDTREHDFPLGARDGRRSNFVEVDRRCTYKPWLSFHNENDSIFSTIHSAPQLVSPVNQCDISYRESLMLFAKGLGPTAQMIANRKLQGCLKDAPNFQTPASNSSRQVATCQVPAAFASAHNGPRTLDTLIPNTSWDLFDPLPGCCSALKTTTDIIDLTDADDGEKAHMSDRMGDHSALGGKVVGNCERDGKKTFSISDRDKVLETQISNTHLGLSSSTSGAEVLNYCKSLAATVDLSKTDSQVQPSNLASENSCSNKFEFKLRNSNSLTPSSSWIWHTSGVSSLGLSDGSMAAAVGPKAEKSSSSLQQGGHTVESNGVVPLVSPFAFDLPFLKARLNQTNHLGQDSFLQPKFQQVSVNEGPIPSSSSLGQVSNKRRTFGRTHQAELTIQSSQLAMAINNQQYSVPSDTPDTNLALQLQL
ncbi:Bromodomain and PHD finger-containing protein 3 [Camellia lanceoleosa]|nr:Bromodomain and PHD finger-containing protein 3 [Camellia lanceoleosa]